LHVSDFIMVPTAIISQLPTESRSEASDTLTSDSDNETALRVLTTESLPTWNDKSEPPQVHSVHPSGEIDIAVPSQGSSPHGHGGSGTASEENEIANFEETPARLKEAAILAMRKRRRKDKEGLESVVKPSPIIPCGAASTSSPPTVLSTMEVERNESDPIPHVLSDSEDVDGERHNKRAKPNPIDIVNSCEDGCEDSVLPLNTMEQSFEKVAIPGGETLGTGCHPFIPAPHTDTAMMEGGLDDSTTEAALLSLSSTPVSRAIP
jgi:hypothetical protein